jgi:carboxymethylenebutenolidase
VLVFPDTDGARETMREMGDHVATMGYVALVPDIYYRAGEWEPFDVATLFTDERERARLATLAGELAHDRIVADSAAYADFLLAWPEVTGSAIGTTGRHPPRRKEHQCPAYEPEALPVPATAQ